MINQLKQLLILTCKYFFSFLNLSYRYYRFIFFCLFLLIVEKAINGPNFIHVRLSYKTNALPGLDESVRKVKSSIVSMTGVSLEGNEIYVRSVQTESKEKGTIL